MKVLLLTFLLLCSCYSSQYDIEFSNILVVTTIDGGRHTWVGGYSAMSDDHGCLCIFNRQNKIVAQFALQNVIVAYKEGVPGESHSKNESFLER